MLSAMAIIFCGCSSGSGYGFLRTASPGSALINTNTNTHPNLEETHARGVCMPISANSSLNIDVECILEYVQGDASFDAADEQRDFLNPWVRLNYSF